MKKIETNRDSYAGVMYSSDFVYWYTYLKRRIAKGWTTEELSFLLGKAPFYYNDFELMHDVGTFLRRERILLDSIYQDSTTESMAFHQEKYETNEKRLVRQNIEEELFYKDYEIIIPWTLTNRESYKENGKLKTRKCAVPALTFKEWKEQESLESLSDATIDIRERLNNLMKVKYFKEGRSSHEIFQQIEFTGQQNLKIYPRHLKDGLYNLIKVGNVYVRNADGRYLFFSV